MTHDQINWHDLFIYDDASGNLIWRIRPVEHFPHARECKRWNGRHAGRVAGSRHFYRGGQRHAITVGVFGKNKYAHVVILEMHGIKIPVGGVPDHINRNPFDNRMENIRVVSNSVNTHNKQVRGGSSSYKGVTWYTPRSKWRAQICHNYKKMHLGLFDSEEDAGLAYIAAATRLFGSNASTKKVIPQP